MDDDYLGYVLDALDPAAAAAAARHLAADPAGRAAVARIRAAVAPLGADRGGYDPPAGLAVAAIARVAEHVAAGIVPPVEKPTWAVPAGDGPQYPGRRRRAELAVLAGLTFLLAGVVVGGVQRVRRDADRVACGNNLRVMYQGLAGYADARGGLFPQVGTPAAPTAGEFAGVLQAAGQLPNRLKLSCPGEDAAPGDGVTAVGYVYTLGYRGPGGGLVGVRRGDPGGDLVPLAADLPSAAVAPAGGPVSPHGRGQNVLYADGTVRYTTTAAVGPNGDDIYRNLDGRVKAGLNAFDASLGRPADAP